MKTWRMHPEIGSKWYKKGPHWRICDDEGCQLQHVDYVPFQTFYADRLR